jgi:hypothetical protein
MFKNMVCVGFFLCFAGWSVAHAADSNISSRYNSKTPIKTYIGEVTNTSGQNQVVTEDFKKDLEEGLLNRKSHTFIMVKSPAESDIQISAAIHKYQYLEHGPMKPSAGPGTMVLDAMATATENYVEMEAEFTVTDTKTNTELWKNVVSTYIKKKMTPDQSIPLINKKTVRQFLWKCFGRQRGV